MKLKNKLQSLATLYRVDDGKNFQLNKFDPGDTAGFPEEIKSEAEQLLQHSTQQLAVDIDLKDSIRVAGMPTPNGTRAFADRPNEPDDIPVMRVCDTPSM